MREHGAVSVCCEVIGSDPDGLAGLTLIRQAYPACLTTRFAEAMDNLGPFEPHPVIAVAVSGGADSMALAILGRDWVSVRGGSTLALVVDHGLRPESASEAQSTLRRLGRLGIPAWLLPISNLRRGPALAERARIMRYDLLARSCRQAGISHLLLGHHAADQVETLAMRVLRGSRTHGLAGMSALLETADLRLLRPLLAIEPRVLRGFLRAHGAEWVEDPSNRDLHAMRPRLRHGLAGHADDSGLLHAASAVGRLRSFEEAAIGRELARRATIRPEGFATLSPGRILPAALGSLIQCIGGARYPANPDRINELAADPKPASIAGVLVVRAGRSGNGWLIVREEAAIMEPVEARADTFWDHRFRLTGRQTLPADATVAKLGDDAARVRSVSDLPSVVLRTLPAVRFGGTLAGVPHLGYWNCGDDAIMTVLFTPPRPAAGPCFVPARGTPVAGLNSLDR